jgi:hypothetical protein
VHLVPQAGVSGSQRVNFAVPLAPGQLSDETLVRVLCGGVEVSAFRRGLACYGDDSLRSVQVQLEQTLAGEADVEVRLGEKPIRSAHPQLQLAMSERRRGALVPAVGVERRRWSALGDGADVAG